MATLQESAQTNTQFYYGKDIQNSIGEMLASKATHVLVVYGSEQLRSLFWYENTMNALRRAHISYVEYGGIEQRASLEQIEEGIAICKKKKIDYILAIGGGSVIDSAKAIAIGANCNRCLWTYCTTERQPQEALPVGVLLTTPGSGSESNDRLMLTNEDTLQNLTCKSPVLRPEFCLVNPELFYTITQKQLAHAVVLMFHRMVGEYLVLLNQNADTRSIEKLEYRMKTLMRKANALMLNRFDDAAWNELVLLGNYQDMAEQQEDTCQRMAQELSSMYEVSYGAVLAVLLPAWMQYVSTEKPDLFQTFGRNVMGVSGEEDAQTQMQSGIDNLTAFFRELGLKDSLCDLGIEDFCFKNAAQVCTGYGWGEERPSGAIQVLYWQDLYQIYQSVYAQPVREEKQPA